VVSAIDPYSCILGVLDLIALDITNFIFKVAQCDVRH
jgi:hypothetical protein